MSQTYQIGDAVTAVAGRPGARAGDVQVTAGDVVMTVQARRDLDGALLIARDGRTFRAVVTVVGTVTWVTVGGQTFKIAEAEAGVDAAGGVDSDLEAPMPGTVLAVECAVGDLVEAGQTLLVVEAMKMEHAIKAPRAGVVAKIAASVGALVNPGAPLVVLDAVPGDGEDSEGETA